MVETRIAPRYRASKTATIESGDGAIDCTVRDLSITGAALTVSNHVVAAIPQHRGSLTNFRFSEISLANGPKSVH